MSTSNYTFPNTQAQDQQIAGIYQDIDSDLINLLKNGQLNPKPLMVCSGGTSSRCAAKGLWTLDLRKKYTSIDFDQSKNEVSCYVFDPTGLHKSSVTFIRFSTGTTTAVS